MTGKKTQITDNLQSVHKKWRETNDAVSKSGVTWPGSADCRDDEGSWVEGLVVIDEDDVIVERGTLYHASKMKRR